MAGVGVVLYAVASYHQTRCNFLLAKQKRANNMKHVIPRGDWFDVVRSPLYTTEMMLYAGFILVTGGTTAMLYLVSAWVVANQVLLATISSQWVEDKFRDRINELPKWKLLPFVW
jgi:protein-S-isoprenylcysteine O-methyltransferase Ste14